MAAYNNLTISGTGAVFPSSLNITDNLTLNQSVNFSGKTIVMTGIEPQLISGSFSPAFDNLTINNTAGGVTIMNNTAVSGTLGLNSGLLYVGGNILTLGANAVSGSFDNTKMLVVGPTGQVRRTFTGTGSYTFPIGENTDGVDYSPITVNVTAGSFSNAHVGVTVVDAIHPNNNSPENNISRYWNVAQSGITAAVATITASYTTDDILGTEANMAAAELNGTFNQQTNPWVKFAPLGSNTLTAKGAVLTSGLTAAFTGIKGGAFSAAIVGYGAFCQNQTVTVTATPNNGDAPYTYFWSNGLGTLSTASPSTAIVGSTSYTVTVKDSNGVTTTDTATVTVLAPTVGGTIASHQTICSGSQPANLTLSGNTGSVLYWQSSANSSFTTPTNIANTSNTLTGATIGSLTNTTYYRAVVQNGSCSQVNSDFVTITVSAIPTTATNTSTQTLCSSGTASLSGNTPLVGTGTWSVVSGPSTSSSQFSNINNPASVFASAGGSGNYVVRWTISNPPCTDSSADATITISGSGAPPTATNNSSQTICATSNATLSANTPTVGTGAWSVLNGPSSAPSQFSSLSNPTAIFTASGGAGIYQIRWTITNFSCTASADATITVVATPTTATNISTQTICGTSTATLAANTPTVGTGVWSVVSGPSTSSSQFANSANPLSIFTPAVGAGTYVLRWTISNSPCSSSSADATITVSGISLGGTISGGTSTCSGSTSGTLTLSGHTGTIVRWESSTDSFTTINTIATTTTSYTSGTLTQTTQFRAVVQSGGCGPVYSTNATISIGGDTTWNGTSWSNGAPTSTTSAIISGNYTTSGTNINACTLTVNNNAVVTISSGDTITLNGALTVVAGSNVTFNNNAILLQNGTTNTNSGNITIARNSSALKRLDYTLWSSPVAGQQLIAFSPLTLTNRFYDYAPSTNLYTTFDPSTNFQTANGYLIRTPNTHPLTATVYNGVFTGVPNSGNYSRALEVGDATHRFNLVGNPYPSPISMTQFVSENTSDITGTLYFWRKTNNALSPSYCSWTAGTFVSNGEAQVVDPNGILQTGQGFFVEAKASATAITFANTQRISDNADQFFRNTETFEQHRIWLNAANSAGAFSQMEVGYVTGATQDLDMFDGKYINDGNIALYGIAAAQKLVIQGRALPFTTADVVPLGFKTDAAGTFTISIDHVDGLFSGNQDIFLKDNSTLATHDLKSSPYIFVSSIGTFDDRFEIVYTNALATTTATFDTNQIIAYKANGDLIIKSAKEQIASIKVFDSQGRLLAENNSINSLDFSLKAGWAQGLLLVQIRDANGRVSIKKVLW